MWLFTSMWCWQSIVCLLSSRICNCSFIHSIKTVQFTVCFGYMAQILILLFIWLRLRPFSNYLFILYTFMLFYLFYFIFTPRIPRAPPPPPLFINTKTFFPKNTYGLLLSIQKWFSWLYVLDTWLKFHFTFHLTTPLPLLQFTKLFIFVSFKLFHFYLFYLLLFSCIYSFIYSPENSYGPPPPPPFYEYKDVIKKKRNEISKGPRTKML